LDNTFEIRDEEIDVEEIMRKIRENIRMRREAGIYPKGEIEEISPTRASRSCHPDQIGDAGVIGLSPEARRDLDYINSSWDVENKGYFISSHRPVAGRFLIRGRELVHGEVRRYVDPAIWKQKEFNASVVRLLNEVARGLEEIGGRLAKIEAALQEARSETAPMRSDLRSDLARLDSAVDERIGSKVAEMKSVIDSDLSRLDSAVDERIDSRIEEGVRREANAVISAMNQDIQNKASLASILEGRLKDFEDVPLSSDQPSDYEGINYFVFEEAFRGSRETIKERQSAFVRYFESAKNVLDIGCGRGEFLELVGEHGIEGKGIDIDEDMVNFCKSKGLDVERIDAISYLEKIEDKSLDGIFIDQVVEHLEPDYLIRMIGLSYKKLIYGGTLIVETVNPQSFASFVNFYIDMSHKRPVHPETLKFLLEAAGFRELETKFLAPVPEEVRLRRIDLEHSNEREKRLIEICNHNIDMINSVLFGAQDYAVMGKK